MQTVRGKSALGRDRAPVSEVALIFDENSQLHVAAPRNRFLYHHTWMLYQNALRMGAPFDMYLLQDLEKIPPSKLYLFMNVYFLDQSQRERIQRFLKKINPGAVVVWNYAPGFLSEKGFDPAAMHELTGFDLRHVPEQRTGRLIPFGKSGFASSIGRNSPELPVGPWFYCADSDVQVLGTFSGKPALVLRNRSLWSLMPFTREMLTDLCDFAGVHVYSRSGDVLTGNRSYIMLHTATSGDKIINLPKRSTVSEIFTGKTFPAGNSFRDPSLPSRTTRIYSLD